MKIDDTLIHRVLDELDLFRKSLGDSCPEDRARVANLQIDFQCAMIEHNSEILAGQAEAMGDDDANRLNRICKSDAPEDHYAAGWADALSEANATLYNDGCWKISSINDLKKRPGDRRMRDLVGDEYRRTYGTEP